MKQNRLPFFFLPPPPVPDVVVGAVEKMGKVIDQSVRVARLRSRVRWFGYKMIDCGNGEFAFTKIDNDLNRHPDRGGYSLEDAERFVRARENEPIF